MAIDPNTIGAVDPSTIQSPLALIALFVAAIEAFLLVPIIKLQGRDRTILVIFVISYPSAIAALFFAFLWFDPVKLYRPDKVPVDLQQAFLNNELSSDRADVEAVKFAIVELSNKVALLQNSSEAIRSATRLAGGETKISKIEEPATRETFESRKDEILTRAQAFGEGDLSKKDIERAANVIQKEEEKRIEEREYRANTEMSKFINWISTYGLDTLSTPTTLSLSIIDGDWAISNHYVYMEDVEGENIVYTSVMYFLEYARHKNYKTDSTFGNMEILGVTANDLVEIYSKEKFSYVDKYRNYEIQHRELPKLLKEADIDSVLLLTSIILELTDLIISEFGEEKYINAAVYMMNRWSAESTPESSLHDLAKGLEGDPMKVSELFAKYGLEVPPT